MIPSGCLSHFNIWFPGKNCACLFSCPKKVALKESTAEGKDWICSAHKPNVSHKKAFRQGLVCWRMWAVLWPQLAVG